MAQGDGTTVLTGLDGTPASTVAAKGLVALAVVAPALADVMGGILAELKCMRQLQQRRAEAPVTDDPVDYT